MKRDLESLIADANFDVSPEQAKSFFANLTKLVGGKVPNEGRQEFFRLLDGLRAHLSTPIADPVAAERRQFWLQQLRSMKAHAEYRWRTETDPWDGVMSRDAQMADNLKWLAEMGYPKSKIVVWAASFHIARNLKQVEVPDGSVDYSELIQMGHLAHQRIKTRKLFTIGFTAYQGEAGTWFGSSWNIGRSPTGTFEDVCYQAGLKNACIPLSGPWNQDKQFMRPLGYSWMKSRWSDNFDAIIFNQTMTPSTRN